jgi:hypothetical protein
MTIAGRLRAIAACPTPAAIAELPRLAVQVARIELALDEIAADAAEQAMLGAAVAARDARLRRAHRYRLRLVVVR